MKTAKEAILERLNASKRANKSSSSQTNYVWPELKEGKQHFVQLLENNHAHVTGISADSLHHHVQQIVLSHNEGHKWIAPRALSRYPNLADLACPVPSRPFEKWKDALFTKSSVGISLADAGIESTGSLVLHTGPQEPRTLSLLPPCHIVLLHAEDFFHDLNGYFAEHTNPQTTNLLLISGPSKTADIQQTLAYGAHGPKYLYVLIIE